MELNRREKILLALAVLILVPLFTFRFGIIPLTQRQSNQGNEIAQLERSIKNIVLMGERARYLNSSSVSKDVSLSKRVDQTLKSLRVKTKSQITVEDSPGKEEQRLILKVNDINLTELVNLIFKLENAMPVILIESIEISQSFQNKGLFRMSSALVGK